MHSTVPVNLPNVTEQISRRFQEGLQEKLRTCLRWFGLLRNIPNLLVCLNIEQKHDLHNRAVAKIKRATIFLNKRSGTQFYHDWKPMQSIIDMLHNNFQEDHTNSRRFPGGFLKSSRFPGFSGLPGVVKTPCLHSFHIRAKQMLKWSQKLKKNSQP